MLADESDARDNFALIALRHVADQHQAQRRIVT
jgi:hypothetical protein